MKYFLLTLLALLLIALLSALGYWQLSRAHQKEALLQQAAIHQAAPPLTADMLAKKVQRFRRVQLTGHFDNAHTVLLDNTLYHGQVGYEVYTPFIADHIKTPILIDRGFMPMGQSRAHLPPPRAIKGTVVLTGMLNQPPRYQALGAIRDQATLSWPMRIEFVNLPLLSQYLPYSLAPYLIQIDPNEAHAYPIEWVITVMSPTRHYAYAFQWFALALTLLVIWATLIGKRTSHT